MIYRTLTGTTDEHWDSSQETYVRRPAPMLGAGTTLGGMMWELHLPAPDITNPRARFWFTQRGWDRFGRALASEGRLRRYLINVIRRKDPRRSQIVFADTWQMAVLPDKGESRNR